jgi:hypothetical protein
MASSVEIYNRALSRIGISEFISDPAENSKAGNLYRLWYDACVNTCLREGLWNFATRVVALAQLDGDLIPGWAYKYAYPIDCMDARFIGDSNGARSTLSVYSQFFHESFPVLTARPAPYVVMSEAPTPETVRRVICTDMPQAYLLYTARITDPNQFDSGFTTALEWLIAAEIASPFLGAPTGPQVAQRAGQQYQSALVTAKSQTLNESGADYRPESPAISCR